MLLIIRLFAVLFLSVLANGLGVSSSHAGACGFDDCPPGFQNLFCRDFTQEIRWDDTPDPPGADSDSFVCLVNAGGPVNVGGDITYFFKLKSIIRLGG
jgi:hypothetical protein